MKKIVQIIGSGFSSLSAACYMAQAGHEVHIYEKNEGFGGRARQFKNEGFSFDMGPTWYWMPDVFEKFFNDFGKSPSDYYQLTKLSPAYRVYFGKDNVVDIADTKEKILDTFESIEPGSSIKLEKYLSKAQRNYDIAINDLVYKPGLSPLELITTETMKNVDQFFFSVSDYIHKHFKDPRLRQILEFPLLFLGAKPSKTPLFYCFMNHADFGLGTWYPTGGMKAVVDGFIQLARELGVTFHNNANIEKITVNKDNHVESIRVNGREVPTSILISGADYHHTEQLLDISYRSYSPSYWNKRVMAPSSLLFYVGFSKSVPEVEHHTLFFDTSFDQHAKDIYDEPKWPEDPLFYASFPSKSDNSAAPRGKEAAIFLIPLAPDIEDTEQIREAYFNKIMHRLESLTGSSLKDSVLFKRSYCVKDFKSDYNSFKGNAYGMANTLKQTAFLRPKLKSKKVKNLYFTGQLTVPGPGVPPSIISGKITADLSIKDNVYESVI
jgi:phytoene desaturase